MDKHHSKRYSSAFFWALKANAERKAGQSQMAIESMKRALSLDPKTLTRGRPGCAAGLSRRILL